MYNEGIKTFTAGEALASCRRVKITAGIEGEVTYADAADDFDGVTLEAAANAGQVAVKLKNAAGTVEIEAAGVITVNATIYGAADGKVQLASTGNDKFGKSLIAASGDGAVIEAIIDAAA